MGPLWQTFTSSLGVYEISAIEGNDDPIEGGYDSDGVEKTLESFVIQVIVGLYFEGDDDTYVYIWLFLFKLPSVLELLNSNVWHLPFAADIWAFVDTFRELKVSEGISSGFSHSGLVLIINTGGSKEDAFVPRQFWFQMIANNLKELAYYTIAFLQMTQQQVVVCHDNDIHAS